MERTPIDYDLLAMFVTVADETSFSNAARRLGIAKGTVSRAITRLEAMVGVELLHRTTHSVALSTAGASLYERTAPHLLALDRAVGRLPERAEEPSGELRITAPPDFGAAVLAPLLGQFALRYPEVRFDLRLSASIVDLVSAGFDVAIRPGPNKRKDSTLTSRRLGGAALRHYASPAYVARRGVPRQFGEPGHDWVVFPPLLTLLKLPKGVRPRFLSNDFNMTRSLVREGVGVGLMPSFLANPDVAAGTLVPVTLQESAALSGSLFFVYPSSGQVPRKVVAFRDFLIDRMRSRALP
jgi:DNA-binding transcriptional LysR family regulator